MREYILELGILMKKMLEILAYWGKTFTPGLAILAVLSIMALGPSTAVSEANGGLSKINASVLETPDIDTRMRCRAVQKGVGETETVCGMGVGGLHTIKVRGQKGDIGQIKWVSTDVVLTCEITVEGDKSKTCSLRFGVGEQQMSCIAGNNSGARRVAATCLVK